MSEAERDNLRIWKLAEKTDPSHTKPVNLGRKFTAIDSYYQIKRATEAFGPLGVGWGWTAGCTEIDLGGAWMAKVELILWYQDPGSGERVSCGPVVGMNRLCETGGKVDDDAFKKATTDALTKSLSYLGFSADVFMGLFDDNKYVAQIKQEFEKKPAAEKAPPLPEVLVKAIAEVAKAKKREDFTRIKKSIETAYVGLTDPASQRYVALQFRRKEVELWPDLAND